MNKQLAFVFPGQGSQSLGMLSDLAKAYPQVRDCFAEASEVLDYDLWALTQTGPEERLNQTDHTQPAMLTAGVAVWRVWQALGGAQPAYLAGHSLGEYTALVCANSLTFARAVQLVAERGRHMQTAVPAGVGAMAAILGLEDAQVRQLCNQAAQDQVVEAVNFNSPGQIVIAGHKDAVERACLQAREVGAKRAILLAVSVPSHSSLMRPAAEAFSASLQATPFETPSIPVIHNADVSSHSTAEAIREALMRQIYNPVRWVETIQYCSAQGITRILEAGPGKVLTGLNKRIEKGLQAEAIHDPASLTAALATT